MDGETGGVALRAKQALGREAGLEGFTDGSENVESGRGDGGHSARPPTDPRGSTVPARSFTLHYT